MSKPARTALEYDGIGLVVTGSVQSIVWTLADGAKQEDPTTFFLSPDGGEVYVDASLKWHVSPMPAKTS